MAETVELAAEATADLAEGFKMTKLGPLPREWEVKQFNNVVDEIMAGDWGQDNPDNGLAPCRVLRGTDFARATRNDVSNVPIRYMRSSSIERRRLRPGDVLVELSGGSADQPTGRVLLVTHGLLNASELPVLFSNFVKRIRTSPQCIPEYFVLFWRYLYELGVTRMYEKRTTGIRNFKLADFLTNELIAIPPLSEQRAIAHVLRIVQRAKDATERVLTAVRELKKSLMRYLFTYGPVPVEEAERVPLKETEIGLVPEHWQVARLGDLFNIQQGKAVSPKHRKGQRPLPFLRTANVYWGRIDISRLDYMDFDEDEVERLALRPGDLLVCEGGDIGRTAMWDGQLSLCLYQNHLHRLRAKRIDVEPAFYMYWMQTAWTVLNIYAGTGNKTTIPNLSQSRIASFTVPFPPLHEQREIARILETVDRKIEAEEQRKAALDALFKTLLHVLMTGRVRVKDLPLSETEGVSPSASWE